MLIINYLSDAIDNARCIIFADDTTIEIYVINSESIYGGGGAL